MQQKKLKKYIIKVMKEPDIIQQIANTIMLSFSTTADTKLNHTATAEALEKVVEKTGLSKEMTLYLDELIQEMVCDRIEKLTAETKETNSRLQTQYHKIGQGLKVLKEREQYNRKTINSWERKIKEKEAEDTKYRKKQEKKIKALEKKLKQVIGFIKFIGYATNVKGNSVKKITKNLEKKVRKAKHLDDWSPVSKSVSRREDIIDGNAYIIDKN